VTSVGRSFTNYSWDLITFYFEHETGQKWQCQWNKHLQQKNSCAVIKWKPSESRWIASLTANCVLAGASGTHSVCCVLLIRMSNWCLKITNWLQWRQIRNSALYMPSLLGNDSVQFSSTVLILFQECTECPGSDKLQKREKPKIEMCSLFMHKH
jgi:hypothetical protein